MFNSTPDFDADLCRLSLLREKPKILGSVEKRLPHILELGHKAVSEDNCPGQTRFYGQMPLRPWLPGLRNDLGVVFEFGMLLQFIPSKSGVENCITLHAFGETEYLNLRVAELASPQAKVVLRGQLVTRWIL